MQRIPVAQRVRRLARALAAALLGVACTGSGTPDPGARAGAGPTVILLSLDGTTPAAALAAGLPTFAELARRGASASQLVPVFPTNTFPNHVTLATGVWPDVHGIVNNVFVDPERGRFRYEDDPDWIEVEPIWSLAARHGVVSASFHWVGSEGVWRDAGGPRHWRRFDPETPEAEKVRQILAWLDLEDAAQRPRLVTAWFRGADAAAHRHGPDSDAVRRALAPQDAALAQLLRGLERRGAVASTTLLVVSDHGMAPVEHHVDLQAALEREDVPAAVLGAGGFASVVVNGDSGAVARAVAVARGIGLEAWPRARAPASLRVDHPRFGDVVALAPPGIAIARAGAGRPPMRGAHGYRPADPGMGALFVALGRGAPAGVRLGPLRSVDIAPTLLALLGVPVPDWMEGRPIRALLPGEASVREGTAPVTVEAE